MNDLLAALRGERRDFTTQRASLESHMLACAAEEARHHHQVIDMQDF